MSVVGQATLLHNRTHLLPRSLHPRASRQNPSDRLGACCVGVHISQQTRQLLCNGLSCLSLLSGRQRLRRLAEPRLLQQGPHVAHERRGRHELQVRLQIAGGLRLRLHAGQVAIHQAATELAKASGVGDLVSELGNGQGRNAGLDGFIATVLPAMRHEDGGLLKDRNLVDAPRHCDVRRHGLSKEVRHVLPTCPVLLCELRRLADRNDAIDMGHLGSCTQKLHVEILHQRPELREGTTGDDRAHGAVDQRAVTACPQVVCQDLGDCIFSFHARHALPRRRNGAPIMELILRELVMARVPAPRSRHDGVGRVILVGVIAIDLHLECFRDGEHCRLHNLLGLWGEARAGGVSLGHRHGQC
mmetsp:Transcript_71304/g.192028  ORF Transcript_71304/g.192028 Transcript_71304/m.192028 type:complete len:358 (+) Transcript_71304:297-1370(+)